MSVTPTIYSWPSLIVPINQLFYAGGEATESVFTVGGVLVQSPEVGGRAFLQMDFNYMRDDAASRLAGWLMARLANGNVFRVPIWRTVQIATPDGVSVADEVAGIPWDTGEPWDTGMNWAYEPTVKAKYAALEGAETLVVDTGPLGSILAYGHVIGPATGGAHQIMNISYVGTEATLTISPPLRKNIAINEIITLRPTMYAAAENAENFRAMFEYGKWVRPGSLTMMEAIV